MLTGDFPWQDNTFDGVMSNGVFLDIGSVEEIKSLQSKVVFPNVDYQALVDENPTVIMVGKK